MRVVGVERKSKEPAGTVKEVEEVSGGRVREGRSKLPEEEQQTDEAARSSGPEGVRLSAKAGESGGKGSSEDD